MKQQYLFAIYNIEGDKIIEKTIAANSQLEAWSLLLKKDQKTLRANPKMMKNGSLHGTRWALMGIKK